MTTQVLAMNRFALYAALLAAFLVAPDTTHAQDAPSSVSTSTPVARNLIHGELLGAGGLYSFNYERRFAQRWTARVGFSAYNGQSDAPTDDSVTLLLFPVMVNALIPGGTHNLELGAGPTFGYASATLEDFGSLTGFGVGVISANIAYRYQPPEGGLSFRAGFLPNYSGASTSVWLSLSIGYAF
jgi:hypothetical protein